MNRKMKLAGVLLGTVLFNAGFAQTGDKGHGGDTRLIDQARITILIEKEVKTELILTLEWIFNLGAESKAGFTTAEQEWIESTQTLIRAGLVKDVLGSPYRIHRRCRVLNRARHPKYIEKDASALPFDRFGPVCWSPAQIQATDPLVNEDSLVALAFHEHLHHFGKRDADHRLTAVFRQMHRLRQSGYHGGPGSRPRMIIDDAWITRTDFERNLKEVIRGLGWEPALTDVDEALLQGRMGPEDRFFRLTLVMSKSNPAACEAKGMLGRLRLVYAAEPTSLARYGVPPLGSRPQVEYLGLLQSGAVPDMPSGLLLGNPCLPAIEAVVRHIPAATGH